MDILGPLTQVQDTPVNADLNISAQSLENLEPIDLKNAFSKNLQEQTQHLELEKEVLSPEITEAVNFSSIFQGETTIDAESSTDLTSLENLPISLPGKNLPQEYSSPEVPKSQDLRNTSSQLDAEIAEKEPPLQLAIAVSQRVLDEKGAEKAPTPSVSMPNTHRENKPSINVEPVLLKTELGDKTIMVSKLEPVTQEFQPLSLQEKPKTMLSDTVKPVTLDVRTIEIAQEPVKAVLPESKPELVSTTQQVLHFSSSSPATHRVAIESHQLSVPVQNAQWGEALTEKVTFLANQKVQVAEIELDPPELGRIEIKINITQEQTNIKFVSNNHLVRDAVEQAFPRLKLDLAENGFSQVNVDISDKSFKREAQTHQEAVEGNLSGENESGIERHENASVLISRRDGSGFIDFYA